MALWAEAQLLDEPEHVVRNQQRLLAEPAVVYAVRSKEQLRDAALKRLLDDALEVNLVALKPNDVSVEQHIPQKQGLRRGVQQYVVGDQPRN